MSNTVRAKRYDANSYQLFAGDSLVAVAILYGDDLWRVQNGAGKLCPEYGAHPTPRALAKAMSHYKAEASK